MGISNKEVRQERRFAPTSSNIIITYAEVYRTSTLFHCFGMLDVFIHAISIERLPPLPPTPRIARVGKLCIVERVYRSSVANEFLVIWVRGSYVCIRVCVSSCGCVVV